ncbi:MAG: Hypothetical protein PA2244 (similar to DNA topoisomerase IB, but possibly involved in glycosyl-transfer), partial [uncultured Nocardioides sp.]
GPAAQDVPRPGGLDTAARRQGVLLPRPARRAAAARGGPARPGAGHPAGLARRLGDAVPQRTPAGGRHRRRRAAAVPLPPGVAGPARRREVRADGGLRQGAGQGAPARRRRPRPRGHADGAGLRGGRAPARPRLLPDRQRRVRRRERQLRADHPGAPARAPPAAQAGLRLRRQVGRRARDRDRRPGGRGDDRGDAPPPGCRRPPAVLPRRPFVALAAARPGQRVRQDHHRPVGHRQGLPHLARHRAGRRRARRDARAGAHQGLAQARGRRGDEGGRLVPRQHPHPGAVGLRRPPGDRGLRGGPHHREHDATHLRQPRRAPGRPRASRAEAAEV